MCAWTAPRTWTNGEIPTATMFNTHLRDNLNALRPHTTKGDIAKLNAAGALVRLGVSANEGDCLKTFNADAVYAGALGFSVRDTTSPGISHNVVETMTFNVVDSDTYSLFAASVATIPAGWGGFYLFGAGGYYDGHATDCTLRQIGLNTSSGVDVAASFVQDADTQAVWVSICRLYYLAAGNTMSVQLLQRSGATLNFRSAYFWGFKVA